MIDKIEITGSNYKPTESFQKYAKKRLGKLDRYMPRGYKKDIVMKVIVTEVDRSHGNKYEISTAMEVPGGKVIAARDECSNVFAGIDIVEAKMVAQVRRYKLEMNPHLRKNMFRKIFKKG